MKRKLSCLILSLVLMFALTGCGGRFLKENEIADYENGEITGTIFIEYYDNSIMETVSIEVPFELYYQSAPNTVANFYSLVKAGEYSNTLINSPSGFDKTGVTMGNSYFGKEKDEDGKETDDTDYSTKVTKDIGYKIKGEFKENGWEPKEEANNKSEVKIYSMYMVLVDSANYDSASVGFGIAMDNDEKAGRSVCVFGQLTGDRDEFDIFFNNRNNIEFGNSENCAKIVKIEIDGDYSMKLIKA